MLSLNLSHCSGVTDVSMLGGVHTLKSYGVQREQSVCVVVYVVVVVVLCVVVF